MTLVEKVSQLCEERGITRNKFEVESGVGRGQTARWDKNRPSGDKLQMTADYFGVSVSYLLTDEEAQKPAVSDELVKELEILQERPEIRSLLHAAADMTPEQVRNIGAMMESFRGGVNGQTD